MGVTIKNPNTEKLIRELAALTGETQTAAVTRATMERIERTHRNDRRVRIQRAAAAFRSSLAGNDPLSTADLYDDRGLPR